MAETVSIKPELIRWAIERSRLERSRLQKRDLAETFPKVSEWESGDATPTPRQLERFAQETMTPLGYFFLDSPPNEELPFPDFRTVGDTPIERPSPSLLETIQSMQRRQAWMREYLLEDEQDPLDFVSSAKSVGDVVLLAARIRKALGLNANWAESLTTWKDALGTLRDSAERIGVLVATSGIVGLNTHRGLEPQEFRGFVLCEPYAPLIFVNGNDSKSAQMFTVAHELAHLWIGQGGLFNLIKMMPHNHASERFCNQVAAELLVPGDALSTRWKSLKTLENPFKELARLFKVSPVVAARRALDLGLISTARFFAFYEEDQEEWRRRKAEEKSKPKRGGPNFYDVQNTRLGRRFAYAVVCAAREGRLLYREAYRLTDLKGETFDRYANRLLQRMKDERR